MQGIQYTPPIFPYPCLPKTDHSDATIQPKGFGGGYLYRGDYVHLIADDIIELRSKKLIPSLPYITEDESNDKSKSDPFVRIIAIFQILSVVIQIIIRASRQLAVSQLEIAVVAFAVCAIIIYAFNWHKPQGVKLPIVILNYNSTSIPQQIVDIVGRKDNTFKNTISQYIEDFQGLGLKELRDHQISNLMGTAKTSSPWRAITGDALGLSIGSAVFGGVHLLAWNFTFPTRYEQIAWRVTSDFCAGGVPFFPISFGLLFSFDSTTNLVKKLSW